MSFFGANPPLQQPPSLQPIQQPQQLQQQQPISVQQQTLLDIVQNAHALTAAVSGPEVFGDERDEVLSRLNQLLAALGTGGGYFHRDLPPFPFSASNNLFYRLKGVGYNRLSRHKNTDGLVSLVLNSSPSVFENAQQKIKVLDVLNAILRTSRQPAPSSTFMLGSIQQQQQPKANVNVEIKSIIPLSEQQTELLISAKEFGAGGRGLLTASDLFNELEQRGNELRAQLGCEKLVPRVEVDQAGLEQYLRRPPPGFEEIWAQAIRENPDPDRLIPYPIQGFQQLLQRKKMQASLLGSLHAGLENYVGRLGTVQGELLDGRSRYARILQTQKQLSSRLLLVLATQTQQQRQGQNLEEKEEQLQCRLESMNVLLNGPGKLKEQLSSVYEALRRDNQKLRQSVRGRQAKASEAISRQDMAEVRRCLATRQQLLENLVQTLKQNSETLKIVEQSRGGGKAAF